MKKFLIGGVVVFIVLVAIAGASGDSDAPQKVGDTSTTETEQTQMVETPEEKQPELFTIGDQVQMGDIILTVNEVETSSGGQFTSPSEGNEWVNLNLTIENTGTKQEYITTMGQMNIVDSDGNQYSVAVTDKVMENVNASLDGAVVAKAKKTGWVGFEVPQTASNLTFRYNASFWDESAILVKLDE